VSNELTAPEAVVQVASGVVLAVLPGGRAGTVAPDPSGGLS
jgi:hypothetical protein